MSRKSENTNVTVKEVPAEVKAPDVAEVPAKVEEPAKAPEPMKISPYATNAMRGLIIQKSLDGQRRAINLNQVTDSGLTEVTLAQWKYNCDSLYDAAVDYSKALATASKRKNDEAAQKAVKEAEQECWNRWRTIIKVGEKDIFHPNMFVRRQDVENIRVLAAESDELHIDGVGFVPTVKGREAFRAKIEIRLACRIAGNEMLLDDDRQTLIDMSKAERTIDSCTKLLNGYTQGKTVVSGIQARILEADEELKNTEETLKKAGIKDVTKYTKRLVSAVNTLKEQKTSAEKRLRKATKAKEELQKRYDEIVAGLDSVESGTIKK